MTLARTLFINTRPWRYHDDTAWRTYAALGIEYQHIPLLDMTARPLTDADQQHLDELAKGGYRLLVVISPTVVAYAKKTLDAAYWQRLATLIELGILEVIAVGAATARALEQLGIWAHTPAVANNEGMLAMREVSCLDIGDRVLFWRGVGGRRLLSDTLCQHGVMVQAIEWYQRIMPPNLLDNISKLTQSHYSTMAVLISSELAFNHWQYACNALAIKTDAFEYITLGERLAAIVRSGATKPAVHIIDTLHPKNLIDCMQRIIHPK
ncbi:MAG: uroporphyrinogen-III synthase [Moraxella sp.]|nr:uroporphyrinogen-III synthase [Moraxella sp.]